MNNDGLDKLKDLGAQKIYEDTHIAVEHIQAILHESYDGLSKIHFVGFISILQREYNIDLDELKQRAIIYYDEKNPVEETTEDGIFIAPKKSKNFTIFYILLAMILFLIALFYTVEYANDSVRLETQTINNEHINDAKKNMKSVVTESNSSNNSENNVTVIESNVTKAQEQKSSVEPKAVTKSLKIIARSKVWMGYIDVATNKKYQKTFEGEFDLDPNKEWLLIFGHGYIDVIINSEKTKFQSKRTLRLLYKDGTLKKITLDEFKRLNRGNAW